MKNAKKHIFLLDVTEHKNLTNKLYFAFIKKRRELQTEHEIFNGCLQGKREAQHALYKQYYGLLMRVCMRYVKSEQESASILNNAFLKIFQKLNTYTRHENFEAWMRKIVVNTALDYLKSEKKYTQQADIDEVGYSLQTVENNNLKEKDILKLLQELPHMQQTVFNLFAIEGYSHSEIGILLDISEANSKWHLFNARKAMQDKINKYYHAH